MLARLAGPFCRINSRKIRSPNARRQDLGFSAATDPADAKLPPRRAGKAGAERRRHARLRRYPGQIARRIPQGWLDPKSRRPAVALFLRTARSAPDRRGARAPQFG